MSIFCSLQKIRGCTAPYFFRNHDIITYLVIFSLPTDSYAHRQRRPTALLYSPRSARTAPPRSRAPSNKSNIVQTGNISTSQLKSLQPSYTTQMLKCQQQTLHRFRSLIGTPCRGISAPNSAAQAWICLSSTRRPATSLQRKVSTM